jgi:hypothetical protein
MHGKLLQGIEDTGDKGLLCGVSSASTVWQGLCCGRHANHTDGATSKNTLRASDLTAHQMVHHVYCSRPVVSINSDPPGMVTAQRLYHALPNVIVRFCSPVTDVEAMTAGRNGIALHLTTDLPPLLNINNTPWLWSRRRK